MYCRVYNICKSKMSDNNSTKSRKGKIGIKGSSTKEDVL